jgi:hypothetical protein
LVVVCLSIGHRSKKQFLCSLLSFFRFIEINLYSRPSASLSALPGHLPIGSGHRPAARSWMLGPPAHASRTPLFLRLGPAPLPDSEAAATWAWARNLPHTALSSARPNTSARPGDRDQATSARTQHLMLNAPAHGAAASRHVESLLLPALYPRQIPIVVVLR